MAYLSLSSTIQYMAVGRALISPRPVQAALEREEIVMRTTYGEHRSQFFDTWEPETPHPVGTAVAIHGGWWRDRHDLHLMGRMCAHLTHDGWRVHNLEFRRTVRYLGRWPWTLDDVLTALSFLCIESPRPVLIVLSAGCHLALMASRNQPSLPVVALAPITALVDSYDNVLGEGATSLFVRPATAESLREASPLYAPTTAPQFIVHGTADDRVPLEHSRTYIQRACVGADDIELYEVADGDHFCLIDPHAAFWPVIEAWMRARSR